MKTKEQIEKELAAARAEYRKVASILAMMEKGTRQEDLTKMRQELLEPLRLEIQRLEKEL